MKKRLLSALLVLTMVLSMVPFGALAEDVTEPVETTVATETTEATEATKATEPTKATEAAATTETIELATPETTAPSEPTAVEKVQKLIDALPETVTAENREEVEEKLTAIDDAKLPLTDEEREELDFGKYNAAIAAIDAMDGQPGAQKPNDTATGPSYTIILDANGGELSTNLIWCDDDGINGVHGDLPIPTWDGHAFLGWYTEQDGGTKITADTVSSAHLTLYAHWSDGSNVKSEEELRACIEAGISNIKLGANITLTDTLTISGKTLTLDLNGHKLSSSDGITVLVGKPELGTVVPGTLTVTDSGSGGTIENTNTEVNSGYCVIVMNSAFTLKNGTLRGGRGVHMSGSSPSFQMQGGSIVATVGIGVYVKGNFTFSGGTISGKNYSIYCNGTSTLQGGRIQSGNVGCGAGSYVYFLDTELGDGVQLKATVSENRSVTFKNSDGNYYAATATNSDGKITAPTTPTAPTGTAFAGWYTAEGEKWDFEKRVTEDMTLTARFESIVTTVSTEAALKEALEGGSTNIKLAEDIVLAGDLMITEQNWNLDLNGHTLSGSQIKFDNGKMTVTDSVGGGSVNNSITLTSATLSGTMFKGYVNCVMNSTIDGGAFYGQVNLLYGSDVKNGLFYAQDSFGSATTTGKQVVFQLDGSFLRMQVTTGTVAEPEVAKSGYTFTGWCQDADCKGDKWDFTKPVSENMTLYGKSEIITYTITYDKGADDATGTIANGTKEYGKDFTLNMATYSRKGYVQVGWKGSDGKTYTGGAVYQDNADLTLTAIWEEVNSFTVPFTKTVKQSGSTKPGKATFSLYICGIEKLPSASGDIDCTGRVDIKGTGNFTGELTISGSRELVWAMLENGIYIREWDSEMDNWTYDDSVYFLRLNQYDDGYQLDVYNATAKTVGQSMVFSHGNKTVKMTFTNTYGTTTTTADSSNPKTGDNISVAVATLILSAMALVAILPRKKRM